MARTVGVVWAVGVVIVWDKRICGIEVGYLEGFMNGCTGLFCGFS